MNERLCADPAQKRQLILNKTVFARAIFDPKGF